ncbi:MAG: hypothetical protein ACM32E_31835 [Gemmatimonadota bacterium]
MPPSDDYRPDERPGGAVLSPPPRLESPLPPAPPQAGPPGPAGQPPAPPPARQPRAHRPPAARAHQHRATAGLFLAMLSLFGLLAISNFGRGIAIVAFSLLAGVVATWFSATAIGRARHHGMALPRGSITALVIASIGMAMSAILLAGFAVMGRQLTSYSHCLTAANTLAAQQTCEHQFTGSMTGMLKGFRG